MGLWSQEGWGCPCLGNAHNMNMILEELDMGRSDGGGDALQG